MYESKEAGCSEPEQYTIPNYLGAVGVSCAGSEGTSVGGCVVSSKFFISEGALALELLTQKVVRAKAWAVLAIRANLMQPNMPRRDSRRIA